MREPAASSRGLNTARLLRFGSRLAARLNRNWYAVYVRTPKGAPTVIAAAVQRLVADQLTLGNQLGATVVTFAGQDVPDTILRFAAEDRVGQVALGLTHAGMLDAGTDEPVEAVFRLLSPPAGVNVHLQLLSRFCRAL